MSLRDEKFERWIMDKHIKLLYDRLEGDKDRQNRFTAIINGAVKEMGDNGVFEFGLPVHSGRLRGSISVGYAQKMRQ